MRAARGIARKPRTLFAGSGHTGRLRLGARARLPEPGRRTASRGRGNARRRLEPVPGGRRRDARARRDRGAEPRAAACVRGLCPWRVGEPRRSGPQARRQSKDSVRPSEPRSSFRGHRTHGAITWASPESRKHRAKTTESARVLWWLRGSLHRRVRRPRDRPVRRSLPRRPCARRSGTRLRLWGPSNRRRT